MSAFSEALITNMLTLCKPVVYFAISNIMHAASSANIQALQHSTMNRRTSPCAHDVCTSYDVRECSAYLGRWLKLVVVAVEGTFR